MLIEIITVGTVGMETFTNSISTTQTTTSTEDKTIVPTPAGFTPVLQENGYVPKIKGRDLVPRAVTPGPHVVRYSIAKNAKTQSITPTQYPNAVVCTQPSSAMYNHFTDDYWQNTLHYTAQGHLNKHKKCQHDDNRDRGFPGCDIYPDDHFDQYL